MSQTAPLPVGTGIGTGYSSVGGSEVVYIPGLGTRTVSYNLIQNNYTSFSPNSGNCCPCLMQYGDSITVLPNTLYTYAIVYKCDTGYTHPNFMYHYEYNGGTYVTEYGVFNSSNRTDLGNGWWWAWNTFTTAATTNRLLNVSAFYYQYSNTVDKLSVASALLTPGNYTGLHPKYWPAMNTTRSNTTSLTDLTGKNTITANSLTYSASGAVSFGGSDYATVGAIAGSFSSFTVCIWFNSSSVSNYRNPIDCNYSTYPSATGNVGPRLEQNSSGNLNWVVSGNTTNNSVADNFTVQNIGLLANTWYHVCLTWTSGSANTYLNGASANAVNAATPNGFTGTFGSVVIGKGFILGGTERPFIGIIGAVNIYNRVLSADEIAQNFNALRGVYGI